MNQPQVKNGLWLWRALNCPMLMEVISYNVQLQYNDFVTLTDNSNYIYIYI